MDMKNSIKLIAFVSIAAVALSCKNRDAEKRIAELESRNAELESKLKTTAQGTAMTPGVNATPADQSVKPEGPLPVIEFENIAHDFGTIKEGDVVEYTYKFKNTGADKLVIQNAVGSCGCTVPSWSKEPIPVGGSGFITAKFDSKGKSGYQEKTVTVTANTFPAQTVLKFKAQVAGKEGAAK
jgi:hypothetical protein